jgi:hypothetical protein
LKDRSELASPAPGRVVYGAAPFVGSATPLASEPWPHPYAGFGRAVVAALAAAALAACAGGPPADDIGPPPGMETTAPAPESAPPTLRGKPPSGLVDMREVQIAYLGSAGGGKGTLTYEGQTYPFIIAGLGGGGIGLSTIDASGEIYNLTDLAAFPGAYDEARYGAVVGDASTGDLWLENNRGVVMHLKAKREGLMLSLGADVVDIRMDQ